MVLPVFPSTNVPRFPNHGEFDATFCRKHTYQLNVKGSQFPGFIGFHMSLESIHWVVHYCCLMLLKICHMFVLLINKCPIQNPSIRQKIDHKEICTSITVYLHVYIYIYLCIYIWIPHGYVYRICSMKVPYSISKCSIQQPNTPGCWRHAGARTPWRWAIFLRHLKNIQRVFDVIHYGYLWLVWVIWCH